MLRHQTEEVGQYRNGSNGLGERVECIYCYVRTYIKAIVEGWSALHGFHDDANEAHLKGGNEAQHSRNARGEVRKYVYHRRKDK